MTGQAPLHSEALERFLDGSMTTQEVAAFQAQLAASPELQAELAAEKALQQQLDASLRTSFAPATMTPLLTQAEERSSFPIKKRREWSREYKLLFALAAVIALVVGFQAYTWVSTPSIPERPTLVQVYEKLVDTGFHPQEQCTTTEKFAKWMGSRYSSPLAPVEDRPDVRFVGWSYSTAISGYTGVLLAMVDNKPVVVVLDSMDNRDTAGAPCWRQSHDNKQVNVFPIEIAGVALYEITPHDKPRIIDNLAPIKK